MMISVLAPAPSARALSKTASPTTWTPQKKRSKNERNIKNVKN
jgi:hypothetical protein